MCTNNPNPYSARMTFQWKYFSKREGLALNIGCADDPLGFSDGAMHFDIDDWSYLHRHFHQGDAHQLPFDNESFHTVIMGDILEHAKDPVRMVTEAMRVCRGYLVITVFEEWKLPGPGQWIKEGQQNCDEESARLGYKDREDFQAREYPRKQAFPDHVIPHLGHINQFTDEDIGKMAGMIQDGGFEIIECLKAFEITHEDHDIYNWLVAAKRKKEE